MVRHLIRAFYHYAAALEPHKSVVNVGGSSGTQPSPGGVRSPGQLLSREQPSKDDLNGVLESSPVYVTSVPNLTSEVPRERSRSRSSTPNRTSPSPRRHHSARGSRETPPTSLTPSPRREAPTLKSTESSPSLDKSSRRSSKRKGSTRLTNGHHGAVGEGGVGGEGGAPSGAEAEAEANKSGDELELTHDLNDTLDDTEELDADEGPDTQCDRTDSEDKLDIEGACLSESGDSLPGTPEKNYGIVRSDSKKSSRSNSRRDRASPREVLLDHDHQELRSVSKTPVHAVSSCDSRDSTRF
ncbi:hypothetical protein SK128_005088 [Halocaridina rubra]|uniref:Uncharacterized protein n=1 Tax=Halocaridina rubra TaxID=373956 RepID=A0AAN8ZZN8_HALRR